MNIVYSTITWYVDRLALLGKKFLGFTTPPVVVVPEEGRAVEVVDFARFIFTHDAGSAIRGPGRLDLFFGSGSQAEAEARAMRYPGRVYLFAPRS